MIDFKDMRPLMGDPFYITLEVTQKEADDLENSLWGAKVKKYEATSVDNRIDLPNGKDCPKCGHPQGRNSTDGEHSLICSTCYVVSNGKIRPAILNITASEMKCCKCKKWSRCL